jgi:hypothetical protein
MECLDLGCVIVEIIGYVLKRTEEQDAVCSADVDLRRSVILNSVKKLVLTCAVTCLKCELATEKSCEIDLCGSFLKLLYGRLVLDAAVRDVDLLERFDNGCEVNVADYASVFAEALGM